MLNINITYTLECYSDIKENEITIWDNMVNLPALQGYGFPGDAVVKHLPANVGDVGSIPGS